MSKPPREKNQTFELLHGLNEDITIAHNAISHAATLSLQRNRAAPGASTRPRIDRPQLSAAVRTPWCGHRAVPPVGYSRW